MQANVKAANAQSIGLTIYPPYPTGYFKNSWLSAYYYQNGGDWTWFGGRTIQQLIANGFYHEAYEAISPMLDRVIATTVSSNGIPRKANPTPETLKVLPEYCGKPSSNSTKLQQ